MTLRRLAALAATVIVTAAACGDDATPSGGSTGTDPATVQTVEGSRTDAVAGINRFGFELQRIVGSPNENLVFSPASIGTAFAMAYAAADDATRATLEAGFGFPDAPAVHDQLESVLDALAASQSDDVTLTMANSGWAQEGQAIGQEYLETIAGAYDSQLETLDLQGEPDASIDRINEWVAEQTQDRIPELLRPGFIDPQTVYVLVNALYLAAEWDQVFGKYPTEPEPFTRSNGSAVDVDTMHNQELRARFLVEAGLDVVELPLAGGDLAMVVAVPDDLETFEADLDPSEWERITTELRPGVVDLALPKWDIDTTIDLAEPLAAFGVEIPGGDYSGIAPGVFLGGAVHGANMTVDEQGVVAAAGTALGFQESGPPPPDATIRADRPFAFAVVHQPTGLILFTGHVADPGA